MFVCLFVCLFCCCCLVFFLGGEDLFYPQGQTHCKKASFHYEKSQHFIDALKEAGFPLTHTGRLQKPQQKRYPVRLVQCDVLVFICRDRRHKKYLLILPKQLGELPQYSSSINNCPGIFYTRNQKQKHMESYKHQRIFSPCSSPPN